MSMCSLGDSTSHVFRWTRGAAAGVCIDATAFLFSVICFLDLSVVTATDKPFSFWRLVAVATVIVAVDSARSSSEFRRSSIPSAASMSRRLPNRLGGLVMGEACDREEGLLLRALGNALSSTPVEDGGRTVASLSSVSSLKSPSLVRTRAPSLSLSLSLFPSKGACHLGFGTVAAVMRVTTTSPGPDFSLSLSVCLSFSLCLSFFLSLSLSLSLSFFFSLSLFLFPLSVSLSVSLSFFVALFITHPFLQRPDVPTSGRTLERLQR